MALTPKTPKIDRDTLAIANPGLDPERIEALAQVYEGFATLRLTLKAALPPEKMAHVAPSLDGLIKVVELQMRT